MWRRNSLSLSSKLAHPNSTHSLPFLIRSSPKSHHHDLLARSNSSRPEPSSAVDPVNWAQSGSHGHCATSAITFDFPSLAAASAFKAKEVADLAKHYGRCYWELSKARLSMLVVATSGAGYILGSGSSIDYLGSLLRLCWHHDGCSISKLLKPAFSPILCAP